MYVHIIDRSDLDQVIAIEKNGTKVTRRMELEAGCFLMRKDVVLVNGTRSGKEYAIYVTEFGWSGDLFVLDFLTEEQWREVEAIANRMRSNADAFPLARAFVK